MLKRFDRQGRFRKAWNPIRAIDENRVTVTKDGYIWTGLEWVVSDRLDGLPIMVYQSGKEEPLMDWRYKLPKVVEDKIRAVLKGAGLEWKKWKELPNYDLATNDWNVLDLQCGQDQVSISLYAELMGQEKQIARVL